MTAPRALDAATVGFSAGAAYSPYYGYGWETNSLDGLAGPYELTTNGSPVWVSYKADVTLDFKGDVSFGEIGYTSLRLAPVVDGVLQEDCAHVFADILVGWF